MEGLPVRRFSTYRATFKHSADILVAYKFPKAQERLEELRRGGSRNAKPVNGKLARKDQKKDEAECSVM